jgi:WhiB family redox-sensing transcriptional regulator
VNLFVDPNADKWMEDASCREIGGDMWHPEKGGSTKAAKQICFGCSVRVECLDFARNNRDLGRHGIWGGTSERERRRLFGDEERLDGETAA